MRQFSSMWLFQKETSAGLQSNLLSSPCIVVKSLLVLVLSLFFCWVHNLFYPNRISLKWCSGSLYLSFLLKIVKSKFLWCFIKVVSPPTIQNLRLDHKRHNIPNTAWFVLSVFNNSYSLAFYLLCNFSVVSKMLAIFHPYPLWIF